MADNQVNKDKKYNGASPASGGVDPSMLGTGAASKAGKALKDRAKSLEDKLREAGA